MRPREKSPVKSNDGPGHPARRRELKFAAAAKFHVRGCKLPHPRMPDAVKSRNKYRVRKNWQERWEPSLYFELHL
jgi:hypothetical protein